MRTRLFPVAILLAAFVLHAGIPVSHGADDAKRPPSLEEVQGAIPLLSSSDKVKRLEATKTLFQLDRKVVEDLKKAGAKNAVEGSIGSRRLDMVYTLIVGLPPKARNFSSTSFGVSVEKGTSREAVVEMGKKYGFEVGDFGADGVPSCYVKLVGGANLSVVMRELLSHEPSVVTVNLNYVEFSSSGNR